MNYTITYSVGTSRNDERRFIVKVSAARLASKITALQARPNTSIYSVELAYS